MRHEVRGGKGFWGKGGERGAGDPFRSKDDNSRGKEKLTRPCICSLSSGLTITGFSAIVRRAAVGFRRRYDEGFTKGSPWPSADPRGVPAADRELEGDLARLLVPLPPLP
jgi:hypothetical protein